MPYPPNDGGAIATIKMINGFAEANNKVTVLAMQTYKHPFSIKELPNDIKNKINWYQTFVDTKIKPVKLLLNLIFSKKPYNSVRFESKKFNNKLIEILSTQKFDIIQLEGLYLYSYINTIKKYSKAKISLRAHNIEHEIWLRLTENESSILKKIYLSVIARRVKNLEFRTIKIIDILIPITFRDAKILTSKTVDLPFMVCPTGLDTDDFKQTKAKNKNTIFYIGALDWTPNREGVIWFLKNIWTDIKKEFNDRDFVVAGRNAPEDFKSELKRYSVKYVGEVDSAKEFIDNHNIMIVPLLSGSGMRIKIIEGMARGKCILTTSVGAEGIDAENGKDIFIQNTADEFKQILRNLLQNNYISDNCGKNAFIFVKQNFNNKIIINNLQNFYRKHIDN
jgi:glycosyltransferase involved in cell wall biosynthesis